MEEFYSTLQIAKLLGIRTITVRRWIVKGVLPAYSLGKEYRIKKSDFDKFLEKRRVQI
jgi:excisionase family DNA binding protein